jgi:hypothetical protein
VNAVVYASLAAGLVQRRRHRLPPPADAVAAFQLLERYFKRAFPDISEGFTWREAISRARKVKTNLEWDKIQQDVSVYEAYRYGGGPAPPAPGDELLGLIRALRRVR